MADSIIQVPADSTGKKVDTESLTVGANTVERQRVQIAGSSAAEIAPVTAANGLDVDVTRVQGTVTVGDGGGSLTVDGSVNIGNTPSVDPTDRALRDNGKVDVASFDVSTADLDSGAGTDARLTVGIAVPAEGGAAIVPGDATNGLKVQVTTSALPADAATETTLAALNTKIPASPAQDRTAANVPSSNRLSDGTNFYDATKTGQLPAALVGGRLDVVVGAALPAGANNIGDVDVLSLPAIPAGNNNIGDVDIASIAAGDNNIGNVDVVTLPSIPAGNNNIGDVDIVSGPTGTNALQSQGSVAHDSAVATHIPHLIAARANANEPATPVADGDVTHVWADLLGRLVVLTGHPSPEPPVTANGSAAGTSVIAAPGASLSLYICKGTVHNRAAAETVVSLRDGAAGTIRWTANLAADGGGSLFDFGSRGWKLTANTELIADIGAASADINITEYYIAP